MSLGGLPIDDRARRALSYVAVALMVIGFVNFFWFIAEAISIGSASSGKIVDGHFFLGNKGTYTEVSEARWAWAQLHEASLLVTHPLAIAAIAFLNLRRVFPAKMAGTLASDPVLERARLDLVRDSGPVLAKGSMGGWVGPVSMSAPLLQVEVYPRGLLVRARLMAEHVILAAEILDVVRRRVWLRQAIEISHLGAGSTSPLRLYLDDDDPVVEAIRTMVAAERSTTLPAGAPAEGSTLAAAAEQQPEPETGNREPAIPGLEPGLGAVVEILGLGIGIVLVAMGILWAIPKLGFPGVAWTTGALAILLWNGARVVRRRRSEKPTAARLSTIVQIGAAASVIVGLLTVGMVALSGPPGGRAAVVPQAPAGHRLYLAPMGATSAAELQRLASFYSARYGLSVTVLSPAPIIPRDPARGQVNAEGLVAVLQTTYAEASDPNDVVIGVVGEDMYAPARPDWAYSFGIYGEHLAVISTWRMQETNGPFAGLQTSARLRKFVTRYIGFLFFGLPASTDSHSVLYDPVLSLADLDRMGEDY